MKHHLLTALVSAACTSFVTGIAASASCPESTRGATGMAGCTQDLTPPKQIEMYLDGFHCLKKELNLPAEQQLQIRAAHYCAHHGDMFMCSVYDGTGPDARLVAIEYVINDKTYKSLSPKEKKYWHPHYDEVDTGMLRLPGLDKEKEKATLAFLHSTWGKTWQVWPDLANKLPIGEPVLLWSIDPKKIKATTKAAQLERDTANERIVKTPETSL